MEWLADQIDGRFKFPVHHKIDEKNGQFIGKATSKIHYEKCPFSVIQLEINS